MLYIGNNNGIYPFQVYVEWRSNVNNIKLHYMTLLLLAFHDSIMDYFMGYSGSVASLSDDETLGTWPDQLPLIFAGALHGSSPESLPSPSHRPNTIRSLQDLAAEPALVQISVACRMLEGTSAGFFPWFFHGVCRVLSQELVNQWGLL